MQKEVAKTVLALIIKELCTVVQHLKHALTIIIIIIIMVNKLCTCWTTGLRSTSVDSISDDRR